MKNVAAVGAAVGATIGATKDGLEISANNLEDQTARYILQDILKPELAVAHV